MQQRFAVVTRLEELGTAVAGGGGCSGGCGCGCSRVGSGRRGRRCRRRVERTLTAQVAQQPFAVPRKAEGFQEGRPKFGRHDVVQDGIDGRVDVEHDATEIEHVVVGLGPDVFYLLGAAQNNPQREYAKWQQAQEEEDDHGSQHGHYLASRPRVRVVAGVRRRHLRPVVHRSSVNMSACLF